MKHTYNLSDEEVVAHWAENPYWQHFCGETYFQHQLPIDPSQMTRFRKRIGEAGCKFMRGLTIHIGIATRAVSASSLTVVNVDTTVQEKVIAFPTDARLYHKARAALVRNAKRAGITLRQSYERVSKLALAKNGRYCPGHPLAVLATRLPWSEIESSLFPLFVHEDRAGQLIEEADLFGSSVVLAGAGVSNAGYDYKNRKSYPI